MWGSAAVFFVKDEDFVTKALAVLDTNAAIGQVVFNARYALTTTSFEENELVSGEEVRDPATDRVTHIVHEFAGPAGSPEWQAFSQRPGNGGKVAIVNPRALAFRGGGGGERRGRGCPESRCETASVRGLCHFSPRLSQSREGKRECPVTDGR